MAPLVFAMCIITTIRTLWEYHRVKQVWKLWSFWQSMKLFQETEEIRNNLLQYSFTIRRILEELSSHTQKQPTNTSHDCLQTIEKLHAELVNLSDRLFPAYVDSSLPLAIQATAESWLQLYPQLKINLEIPTVWRQETLENNLIIIRTLEDLLRITLSSWMLNRSTIIYLNSISITLKTHNSQALLEVQLDSAVSDLEGRANLSEAVYLCNSFHYLTNGQCYYQYREDNCIWHLMW